MKRQPKRPHLHWFLMTLQALIRKMLHDQTAKDTLREGRNRERSMALIHQNLHQFDNLSCIDLKRFVTQLWGQIESVFQK